jgi:glycosyltransferase involved in cell wall biosynthesis
MIYYLPIEPLEARYTAQMLQWVSDDLRGLVGPDGYKVLLPDYKGGIAHGQFLDTFASTRFKAEQLGMVATLFELGGVRHDDLFLLGDVWFPGIESIRLMADLCGLQVKIAGWHYAGCFDQADHYSQHLRAWARRFEEMLCEHILDAICVGSKSHADVLARNVKVAIYPFGLSWKPHSIPIDEFDRRENVVLFPHRIAPEKNLPAFLRCARKLKHKNWKFIISVPKQQEEAARAQASVHTEVIAHDSKASYYDLLRRCRIIYSSAFQETFGYAVNEAIASGCCVVAPDRLSYTEVLERDNKFLYGADDQDGAALLESRMNHWLPVPFRYTDKYSDSTVRFLKRILP